LELCESTDEVTEYFEPKIYSKIVPFDIYSEILDKYKKDIYYLFFLHEVELANSAEHIGWCTYDIMTDILAEYNKT